MTLPDVLEAMRRRIVLILIVTLIVAGCGIAIGSSWPKTYTSTAQILLGLDASQKDIDAQSGNLYLRERVATYAQTVKADEIIEPVAEAVGVSPELLRNRISVSIIPETVVLGISVSASTPEEAVNLANAVSRRFSTQVSVLNVETGGPEIVAAQFSSPQPATEPDQLHGWLLYAVSTLVGLLLGMLLAIALGALQLARERSNRPSGDTKVTSAAEAQPTSWTPWDDDDQADGPLSGSAPNESLTTRG